MGIIKIRQTDLRPRCIERVSELAQQKLDALVNGISPGEMVPWLALEAEARAYLADPITPPGPNMQAELGDRAPDELARSIVAKADALRSARAAIVIARRQHVLAIEAMTSAEELSAYDLAAGWPELA